MPQLRGLCVYCESLQISEALEFACGTEGDPCQVPAVKLSCSLLNDRFYLAVLDFNTGKNVPQRYRQNILFSKMNVYYSDA